MFTNYDDLLKFNKANLDAFVLSSTKLATGVEEVTKEYFGYTGKALETAVENTKALTSCKTAAEVLQLQQKFARDAWESAVAEGTKLTEMSNVITKSVMEPIQSNYKTTFDKPSKAA